MNQPCIVGINLTWSRCIIIFIYCCIWFCNTLLYIFVFIFMREIGLLFSFCLLLGFVIRITLVYKNNSWEMFPSLSYFWRELVFFPLWMFGGVCQWSHLGLKIYFLEVKHFFNNSWRFGILWFSRNWSILSKLLAFCMWWCSWYPLILLMSVLSVMIIPSFLKLWRFVLWIRIWSILENVLW